MAEERDSRALRSKNAKSRNAAGFLTLDGLTRVVTRFVSIHLGVGAHNKPKESLLTQDEGARSALATHTTL